MLRDFAVSRAHRQQHIGAGVAIRQPDQCTGQAIDRVYPDMTVVLARPFADPDTACTNWEHAAHGIQGFLFTLADALVKNGQVAAARPVYALVKQTEGFATWSFASRVDERLSSDLDARAAMYTMGGDPRQQPLVGLECVGCHQR